MPSKLSMKSPRRALVNKAKRKQIMNANSMNKCQLWEALQEKGDQNCQKSAEENLRFLWDHMIWNGRKLPKFSCNGKQRSFTATEWSKPVLVGENKIIIWSVDDKEIEELPAKTIILNINASSGKDVTFGEFIERIMQRYNQPLTQCEKPYAQCGQDTFHDLLCDRHFPETLERLKSGVYEIGYGS